MKTIGRTENGGHIVEMSEDEYREFMLLDSVLDGNDPRTSFLRNRSNLSNEMSPAFCAMRLFIENSANIIAMKDLVKALEGMIKA